MSLPWDVLVRSRTDVFAVAAVVRSVVLANGGARSVAAAAAIAAEELAANIVRHGGGAGELTVSVDGDDLTLCASDCGPGLEFPEALLFDRTARAQRCSRAGAGLGEGAASVVRLMDRVEARKNGARGLVVMCRKRLHARPRRSAT